ncbi:unnamed protein product, partial [marine sediment metagenome]
MLRRGGCDETRHHLRHARQSAGDLGRGRIFKKARVQAILHAGDYVAPFALARLLQARLPVYGVFGNCD